MNAIIDFNQTFKYAESIIPNTYKCSDCGASNCKLWREYNTFLNHQTLQCVNCASKSQNKDISTIDKDGRRESQYGIKTDQIGWRIPAVPTEDNNTFWGYTSVPKEGVEWWRKLPTFPNY